MSLRELRDATQVGPALRNQDGKMLGQILERLNGKSVSKIFEQKKFADIHYIRDLMLEVFLLPSTRSCQEHALTMQHAVVTMSQRNMLLTRGCVHCEIRQYQLFLPLTKPLQSPWTVNIAMDKCAM